MTEWIKCSEKMPEHENYVLVCVKGMHFGTNTHFKCWQKDVYNNTNKRWELKNHPFEITHWMEIELPGD